MLNFQDVQTLRTQGRTNREILEMMSNIVPSAKKALSDIDNDSVTPDWQKETRIGEMLDRSTPKNAPSGMGYVMAQNLNKADELYREKTNSINQQTEMAKKMMQPNPFNPFSPENQKPQLPLSAAPRELASQAAGALPLVGGIVGSLAGAAVGLPTGPGAVASGVAGGALGAGVGEAGKQAAQRLLGTAPEQTIGQELKSIGKEAAVGAASELGGRAVIGVGGKLLSPFTKMFDQEIADLAARKGVRLPASSLTESNVVGISETVASKGLFGGGVEKIVLDANDQILKVADDVVKGIGGSEDLLVAGKSITDGAEKFRTVWQDAKNKLYAEADKAISAIPMKEYINVDATKQTLDEILQSKGAASEVLGDSVTTSRLMKIRSNLEKKQSISSLSSAVKELNQLTKQGGLVTTGDEAALRKVAATLSSDLDNHIAQVAPELGTALDKADAFYKEGLSVLESRVGNSVSRLMESPEKLVDSIIKPGSPNDVKRLLSLIGEGDQGPQRIANVRTAFGRKIIDDAIDPKTGNISGAKIASAMKKYKTTMEELYDPDTIAALREVEKLSVALDRGQKVAQGSSTAFSSKISALFISIIAGNIPAAASIAGSDAALSRLFTSEIGRKWITEGLLNSIPATVRSGAGAAVKSGAQMAGQAIDASVQNESVPPLPQ